MLVRKLLKESDLKHRELIEANLDPKEGLPYAIYDTFPESKIGFVELWEGVKLFNKDDAKSCV